MADTNQPDFTLWQTAAVALVRFACGYDTGRRKDDPVYVQVTEGRDGPGPANRAAYSSCGDLAHWLLARLGMRATWVNRRALGHYSVGMNVADISVAPMHQGPPNAPDWAPEPGDILEIWNMAAGGDAHVCVCLSLQAGTMTTGNYGAGGMQPTLTPGAKLGTSALTYRVGYWTYGTRKVQRVLRLRDVAPALTAAPDLSDALVSGELVTALGAVYVATASEATDASKA